MAKDVWDTVLLCERQFTEWKKTLWSDINTEAMEDASKAFVKEVRMHLEHASPSSRSQRLFQRSNNAPDRIACSARVEWTRN